MRVKDIQHKSKNRIEVTYSSTLGIQTFGTDNLYPQMLRRIIDGSPTGASCLRRYSRFIEGDGLRDESLSALVCNRRGETLDDIHRAVSSDLAMYGGFALHIGYNVFCQVCDISVIPFEACRLSEPDDSGYVSKVVIHPDWTGQKTRSGKKMSVKKENCQYVDVFNPLPSVVAEQIEACGGVDYYAGQVLYIGTNGRNAYPISRADDVITEMSTDEGLANVKYRNVRNNFLPSGMLVTKKGQGSVNEDPYNRRDEFDETLQHFQGDTNACKMLQVELETDEDKPEWIPFITNNYDKQYDVTEQSVTERIYAAYGQEPWYCIRIGKVGFSGDITSDAFSVYNSEVAPEQRLIERVLKRTMSYWYDILPSKDFSISPLIYKSNEPDTPTITA